MFSTTVHQFMATNGRWSKMFTIPDIQYTRVSSCYLHSLFVSYSDFHCIRNSLHQESPLKQGSSIVLNYYIFIISLVHTLQVSYIKAVDWYLIVSFLFVFAVLIEYTLVLYLTDKEKQTREEKRHKYKKKRSNPEKQQVGIFSSDFTPCLLNVF